MLLGTVSATLLGDMLIGKGNLKVGSGNKKKEKNL